MRTHELPPRPNVTRVADAEGYGGLACRALESVGRKFSLADDWRFGDNPTRGRLWEPNEFLSRVAGQLNPGIALDLGCGSGRDCVALAAEGWTIQGVDHLADAIARAKALAQTYLEEEDLARVTFDVGEAGAAGGSERLDLVSLMYCFGRDWLRSAIDRLLPGGSLVVEAFTPEHRRRHGRPNCESRIVTAEELAGLATGCEVRHADDALRSNGRHTARLWAIKR